ncbi:sugar phosphate isomerase/epimerase [Olsenella uli]|uniref:sugar phosphate isomerase/epimerase family protein n=1 Tax=Olsenella uli TaxID=133926 RepID=UPI0012AB78D1|nr:sugar phosphate isomerase/epimerase [Olsenella uli]
MANTLRVGIRLHDMAPAPLEERLRRAGELGFSCVHLASKVVYKEYGISRAGLTPGLAAHLREACERAGVEVAVFGCYKNLALEGEALDEQLAEYAACCRFASWLGGCVVGTETGRPDARNRITEERRSDEALLALERGVARSAELAERFGVTLAIEPGFNEVACTPERVQAVLDAVASPALGVLWDPVSMLHASVVAPDATRGEVARMIELCGDDVCVLHAKDFSIVPDEGPLENGGLRGWVDGSGQRLVCHGAGETGAFDFSQVVAWATEAKPHIQCVVENSTPETAEGCLAYLRGL